MASAEVMRMGDVRVNVLDPSELLRPEAPFATKPIGLFRDYSEDPSNPIKERVRKTYLQMHTNMTVDFVRDRRSRWLKFDTLKATIMDALVLLNGLVDESDPDVDVPNIIHAFQTAEQIRKDHPDLDWFHLTGLIHDLGKVMAFHGEPQWAVVGDTFPVGCDWDKSIVYRDSSFARNPDGKNTKYNTKHGMYEAHCGLDNVIMSWGHDEYLYNVLKNHPMCRLPNEALNMIRFHSFYPWHAGGDYEHLCNHEDNQKLYWVLEFNRTSGGRAGGRSPPSYTNHPSARTRISLRISTPVVSTTSLTELHCRDHLSFSHSRLSRSLFWIIMQTGVLSSALCFICYHYLTRFTSLNNTVSIKNEN